MNRHDKLDNDDSWLAPCLCITLVMLIAMLKRQWAVRKRVHATIGDVRSPRPLEEVSE